MNIDILLFVSPVMNDTPAAVDINIKELNLATGLYCNECKFDYDKNRNLFSYPDFLHQLVQ